ncbi:MAG: hypothetical protein H6714_06605 [Myxococcales bacterium]|nr:hypothetical protein [Myxococcales bacterium]
MYNLCRSRIERNCESPRRTPVCLECLRSAHYQGI